MALRSCIHDDCVVVYDGIYGDGCPVCNGREDYQKLEEQYDKLESELAALKEEVEKRNELSN